MEETKKIQKSSTRRKFEDAVPQRTKPPTQAVRVSPPPERSAAGSARRNSEKWSFAPPPDPAKPKPETTVAGAWPAPEEPPVRGWPPPEEDPLRGWPPPEEQVPEDQRRIETRAAGVPAAPAVSARVSVKHVKCKNHAVLPAEWACDKCSAFFCKDCTKSVMGETVCQVCGGPLRSLQIEERGLEKKTFSDEVADCFRYPFTGEGTLMLLVGTACFWVVALVRQFDAMMSGGMGMFFGGGTIFALASAFQIAYAMRIVRTSAVGHRHPPDWPTITSITDDAKIITLPLLVYLLPSILYGWQYDVKTPVDLIIYATLLIVGLFFIPMCLLAVVIFNTAWAINPFFLFASICRVPIGYLLAYTMLISAVVIYIIGKFITDYIPFVGSIPAIFLSLYLLMVMSRVMGLLYYMHQDKLAWFQKEPSVAT